MRKVFILLFLPLFVSLCACKSVEVPDETIMTTQATTTTEQSEASVSTVTGKTDKNDPSFDTVKAYIKSYIDNLEGQHYALYSIDGNSTKELLSGLKWGEQIYLTAVYTIQDGVAVRQEEFRADPACGPPPLMFKNGTIVAFDDDGGRQIYYYFRFEAGELKFQVGLNDYYDSDYYRVDDWDDLPRAITKAEFDRVKKELEGDGQVVELDWKPLAEYGR